MRVIGCTGALLAASLFLAPGCEKKASFPNQIPDIVASLGTFHSALSAFDRVRFDSVCSDPELYGDLVAVLGEDSLAVLSRRIHNPIDSAYVIMTVAPRDRKTGEVGDRYELELFMRKEHDRYWIVAHRLTHSPR